MRDLDTLARIALAATLAMTAACNTRTEEGNAASAAPATNAPATNTGGVARIETPPPAPAPAAQQTAIQTQPGPNGATVALNTVKVTGDILTVQLIFTAEGGTATLPLDQISLIDDATSQRIGMLKDDGGRWMASPIDSSNRNLSINLYESPAVVWMKFPAPPATSKTVSLNMPEVAPFDGVPVTR